MADRDTTPSNLFFLASAAAALATTGNADWDSAFGHYMVTDALQRADAAFGAMSKVEADDDRATYLLEEAYGKGWQSVPEAAAKRREQFEIVSEAEGVRSERYLEPMWAAAINLVLTPAPTLPAALFKIELIKREELDNDRSMPRDPMEVVIEDMARLAGALV